MAMRKTSAAQVKEILLGHVRNAATALKDTPTSDESIHEARKQLKRARASLRLLRDAIGRKAYQHENAALRNAARPLSRVRDAQVMREALEDLYDSASVTSSSSDPIRRSLVREYDSARGSVAGPTLGKVRNALQSAERRIQALPAAGNGALLAAATKRLYRKGSAALAQATVDRTEMKLHEARKQTKYLELALDALRSTGGHRLSKLIRRAKQIEAHLGVDHDLAVLREHIAPALRSARGKAKALMPCLEKKRQMRQTKALRKGRKLYAKKPRSFGKEMTKELAT